MSIGTYTSHSIHVVSCHSPSSISSVFDVLPCCATKSVTNVVCPRYRCLALLIGTYTSHSIDFSLHHQPSFFIPQISSLLSLSIFSFYSPSVFTCSMHLLMISSRTPVRVVSIWPLRTCQTCPVDCYLIICVPSWFNMIYDSILFLEPLANINAENIPD